MPDRPRIGVGVIVTRGNEVLLIHRKGPHGAGTWSPPGGHLEFGETPEQCAVREAQEETGLDVTRLAFRAITNDVFESEGTHYITIWMSAAYSGGTPTVSDPEEVTELGWFAWDALPGPLFLPLQNLLAGNSYPPVALP